MPSNRYDFSRFISHLLAWLGDNNLGEVGAYARRRHGEHATGQPDPYGCAGAANILYTIGEFPRNPQNRADWVNQLQSFQDPADGMFHDPSHSMYHTTAQCVAALELFDAGPANALSALLPLLERTRLERFLNELDWKNPWRSSHDGAGCAAALGIAGAASPQWLDWYFAWLDREVDPDTGWWRRGHQYPIDERPGRFGNLAGSFHYHFNYVHFRREIPYAERVVDSCLEILHSSAMPLGVEVVGFAEIDWIFSMNRAMRQSGYRHDDVIAALREMAGRVAALLHDDTYLASSAFGDIHVTFGGMCALAELQQALPGTIHTPRPLKLVLDRRPFI